MRWELDLPINLRFSSDLCPLRVEGSFLAAETPYLLMVIHRYRTRDAGDRAEETATDKTMLDGPLDTDLL